MAVTRFIDPTHLDEVDATILGFMLYIENQQNNTSSFFEKKIIVSKSLNEKLVSVGINPISFINLKYCLLKLPSNSCPSTSVYHVFSEKILGKGIFGEVVYIPGCLKLQIDHKALYKPKERVAKVITHRRAGTVLTETVTHEHALLYRMDAFSAKTPWFDSSGAVIIMNYFKGKNLEKLLTVRKHLTVDQRIQLSLQAIRQLHTLHTTYGIIHRDLKPANMLLDSDTNTLQIMDFGLSCDIRKPDNDAVGTPLYAAPERLIAGDEALKLPAPLTEHSDKFYLAWFIALLFNADDNPSKLWDDAFQKACALEFTGLFKGISDKRKLSKIHKEEIKNLLQKWVVKTPEERCALNLGANVFEKIGIERSMHFSSDHFKTLSLKCLAQGAIAQNQLTELTKLPKLTESAELTESPESRKDEPITHLTYLTKAIKIIKAQLTLVDDHPIPIQAFLYPLNIRLLMPIKNKSLILFKLKILQNNLIDSLKTLQTLKLEIEDKIKNLTESTDKLDETMQDSLTTLKRLNEKIHFLTSKTSPANLNEVEKHTSRCQKHAKIIRQTLDKLYVDGQDKKEELPSSSLPNNTIKLNLFGYSFNLNIEKKEQKPLASCHK